MTRRTFAITVIIIAAVIGGVFGFFFGIPGYLKNVAAPASAIISIGVALVVIKLNKAKSN